MARDPSSKPQSEKEAPEQVHELKDLRLIVIVVFLVLIVLGAFAIHSSLWGWYLGLGGRAAPAQNGPWQVVSQQEPPPARSFPALQLNPQRDLQEFLRQHERRLRSYGWIAPAAGIIQLPIERAMQLVAEKGLPHWQQGGGQSPFPPGGTNQQTENLDGAFLKKMAQSSLGAIELGQLAATNAQSSQLSDTGHKLVQEHRKLLQQMQQAARQLKTVLPQAPGLKDQLAAQQLHQQQGEHFDKTLATQLLADNAEALEELHEATNKLQSAQVKGLASHLEEKLESEMQDLRDAAKAAGLSQGTILSVIQRQKTAAGVAESPGGEEQGQSGGQGSAQEQSGGSTNTQSTVAAGGAQGSVSAQSEGSASSQAQENPGLDAAFIKHLAQASIAEQQLGRLGARRAQNDQLADLSHKLEQDHTKLHSSLTTAAQDLGISLPEEASLKDQLAWKQLRQQHGTNFDQTLSRQFLADIAALLQETENATNKLQHAEVKQVAAQAASSLQQRLPEAKQAAQAVGVKPQRIEHIIVTQLMAAGAPFPLMAGLETNSAQRQASQESKSKSKQQAQGAASGPGGEQHGAGESGPAPSTRNGSTNQLNLDSAFLKAVAQASLAETQLGELGAQRAQDKQLKDLSRQLAQDARKTHQEMQKLAQQHHTALPKTPDLAQQLELQQLQTEFDQALAKAILKEQAGLLARLQQVKGELTDAQLQQKATQLAKDVSQKLDKSKTAAQATGLSQADIQSLVAGQLQALGGSESLGEEPQEGTGQSAQEPSPSSQPKEKAPSQSGESSAATNSTPEKPALDNTAQPGNTNSAESSASEQSDTGPSPLQLQQQRAHQSGD